MALCAQVRIGNLLAMAGGRNCFRISCAAVGGSTGVSLNTLSLTTGSGGHSTLVPGVSNSSTVSVTAVHTLEGVSLVLSITVALDIAGVGVGQLRNCKCISIVLAIVRILFSVSSKILVTDRTLLIGLIAGSQTGFCLCFGGSAKAVALGRDSGTGFNLFSAFAVSISGVASLGTSCLSRILNSGVLLGVVGLVDRQGFGSGCCTICTFFHQRTRCHTGCGSSGLFNSIVVGNHGNILHILSLGSCPGFREGCGIGSRTHNCTAGGGFHIGSDLCSCDFLVRTVALADTLCGTAFTILRKCVGCFCPIMALSRADHHSFIRTYCVAVIALDIVGCCQITGCRCGQFGRCFCCKAVRNRSNILHFVCLGLCPGFREGRSICSLTHYGTGCRCRHLGCHTCNGSHIVFFIILAFTGCGAGLTIIAPVVRHIPTVLLSRNSFRISCAAVGSTTSKGLHALCLTAGSAGHRTLIPSVSNSSAISVTSVYALEGVGCRLAITVAPDRAVVGVFLLCNNKRGSIILAVGRILFSVASKVLVTDSTLLVCTVTGCQTGCCLCCGSCAKVMASGGNYITALGRTAAVCTGLNCSLTGSRTGSCYRGCGLLHIVTLFRSNCRSAHSTSLCSRTGCCRAGGVRSFTAGAFAGVPDTVRVTVIVGVSCGLHISAIRVFQLGSRERYFGIASVLHQLIGNSLCAGCCNNLTATLTHDIRAAGSGVNITSTGIHGTIDNNFRILQIVFCTRIFSTRGIIYGNKFIICTSRKCSRSHTKRKAPPLISIVNVNIISTT